MIIDDRILELVKAGKKIKALKELKADTGWELCKAKA